jgi:hypothetical protein
VPWPNADIASGRRRGPFVFPDVTMPAYGVAGKNGQKDLGAVGDGVANDGPAFQNVVTVNEASGGGPIIVPPGTYNIGANLTGIVKSVFWAYGATFTGAGAASVTPLVTISGGPSGGISTLIYDTGGAEVNIKAPTAGGLTLGAKGDGVTDDSTAFANLATVIGSNSSGGQPGATGLIPPGVYIDNSTIALNQGGMRLLGVGAGSIIQPGATMANGIIRITGNQCTVETLIFRGASQTPASNPAADAIVIAGAAVGSRILNVSAFYVNGWVLNFLSTTTGYEVAIDNVYSRQCLNGITFDGGAATTNSVSAKLSNVFMDSVTAGDVYYWHNAHDVVCTTVFGSVLAGNTTGHGFHLKGTVAGFQMVGSDILLNGTAGTYACFIEADGANRPLGVLFGNTQFGGGDAGLVCGAGSGISFTGCSFVLNRQGSVFFNSTTVGDTITLTGCVSAQNNTGNVGGIGEISVQSTQVTVNVLNHQFLPGTNAIPHVSLVAGATNLTIIASPGAAPGAGVTTPAFPATTVAQRNNTGFNVMVYIINGVNALTIQVDGLAAALVIPASQTGTIYLPSAGSITPTYGGGTPTWKWYGL